MCGLQFARLEVYIYYIPQNYYYSSLMEETANPDNVRTIVLSMLVTCICDCSSEGGHKRSTSRPRTDASWRSVTVVTAMFTSVSKELAQSRHSYEKKDGVHIQPLEVKTTCTKCSSYKKNL